MTITIDAELLSELKRRVGPGGVSAFVVESIRARLRKDPIVELLDKLDQMYGPLTDEEIGDGERWFTEANERLSRAI